MSKQEKIREATKQAILRSCGSEDCGQTPCDTTCPYLSKLTDNFLTELAKRGVVIKTDRELPDTRWKQGSDRDSWKRQGQKELLDAGYVAVEPLVI